MSTALNPDEHLDGSGNRISPALRTEALEQLLTERGLVDPNVMDKFIATYETAVGPLNGGAKVVAKAWTDPEYKARLLAEGTAAIKELGFAGPPRASTSWSSRTATACTTSSSAPLLVLPVAGPRAAPPAWYKDPAYRARVVREPPRKVLSEMGCEVGDDVEIIVRDSSAEVRWLVLPQQPAGTEASPRRSSSR